MPWLVVFLFSSLIGSLPSTAGAIPPAPTSLSALASEPGDDFDEALANELERQVLDFLTFVSTHWGKNPTQVRSSANSVIEREDTGTLIYARELAEHGVLEGYQFQRDRLARGKYVFLQRPIYSVNEFIEYYGRLKAALSHTYGSHQDDRTIWLNDLYRPLPEYWGVAVLIGHLTYAASWETPTGHISLVLSGEHHSKLALDYRSKDYRGGEEEVRNRTTREFRAAWLHDRALHDPY